METNYKKLTVAKIEEYLNDLHLEFNKKFSKKEKYNILMDNINDGDVDEHNLNDDSHINNRQYTEFVSEDNNDIGDQKSEIIRSSVSLDNIIKTELSDVTPIKIDIVEIKQLIIRMVKYYRDRGINTTRLQQKRKKYNTEIMNRIKNLIIKYKLID